MATSAVLVSTIVVVDSIVVTIVEVMVYTSVICNAVTVSVFELVEMDRELVTAVVTITDAYVVRKA